MFCIVQIDIVLNDIIISKHNILSVSQVSLCERLVSFLLWILFVYDTKQQKIAQLSSNLYNNCILSLSLYGCSYLFSCNIETS